MNYYFAKARITDDMLSGLVQRLEEDGLLEDTVFVARLSGKELSAKEYIIAPSIGA